MCYTILIIDTFFHIIAFFLDIGNFVPFAMGSGGNRASDHGIGNKTPVSPNAAANTNSQQTNQTRKKGRIDVKDVFNNDDDDDAANNAKKRKLVPLGKYFPSLLALNLLRKAEILRELTSF